MEQRPDLTQEQLARTKDLMNLHAREALVESYESLIETLVLPDPNDRHGLAAAIHAKVDLIVTFNLRDFPAFVWLKVSQCAKENRPWVNHGR